MNLHVVNSLTPEYSATYNANTKDSTINPQWGGDIASDTLIAGSNIQPLAQDFEGELADDNHVAFYPAVAYQAGQHAVGNFQVGLKEGNNLVFSVSDFEIQPYSDVRKNQTVTMHVYVDGNDIGSINTVDKGELNIHADESSQIAVDFTSEWKDIPLVPVKCFDS